MVSMEASLNIGEYVQVPVNKWYPFEIYVVETHGAFAPEIVSRQRISWESARIIRILREENDGTVETEYGLRMLCGVLRVNEGIVFAWQEEFYGVNWRDTTRKEHPKGG